MLIKDLNIGNFWACVAQIRSSKILEMKGRPLEMGDKKENSTQPINATFLGGKFGNKK